MEWNGIHLQALLGSQPASRAVLPTPGLYNKIPAHKIFARGWVAQEPIFYTINAKMFQGLGPKRRESCNGDRVYAVEHGRKAYSEPFNANNMRIIVKQTFRLSLNICGIIIHRMHGNNRV